MSTYSWRYRDTNHRQTIDILHSAEGEHIVSFANSPWPFPIKTYSYKNVEKMASGSSKKYVGFLSHYKREAGQAVALIHEMLKPEGNFFLDSNNLRDLNNLLDAVKDSEALIVVLSKNYFSRPWCIAELVVADHSSVPLVSCRLYGIDAEFDTKQFAEVVADYENLLDVTG